MKSAPPPPDGFDPYAPPTTSSGDRPRETRPARKSASLRWTYLALSIAAFVVVLPTYFVELGLEPELCKVLGSAATYLLLACTLTGVAWLDAAFGELPADVISRLGIQKGKAIGLLFVPLFNMYWMFAVQLRLCDGIDAALARASRLPLAPRTLGLAAAAIHVGSMLCGLARDPALVLAASVASHAVWFAYMWQCDTARAEAVR